MIEETTTLGELRELFSRADFRLTLTGSGGIWCATSWQGHYQVVESGRGEAERQIVGGGASQPRHEYRRRL